ncbi:MAG: spore germination protein, partial [Clostridia bacterium]
MKQLKEMISSLGQKITNYYESNQEYQFTIPDSNSDDSSQKDTSILEEKSIYPSLEVNLEYMKVKYNTLINSDIVIRPFTLTARDKHYQAFLIYIDGMVDSKTINDFVLNPLMLRNRANTYDSSYVISEGVANNISVRKVRKFNLQDYIYNCLIPQNSIKKIDQFSEIISGINSGNCGLFIDT